MLRRRRLFLAGHPEFAKLWAGYAIFVEGFRGSRVGVWREVEGIEQEVRATAPAFALVSNADNVGS